MNHEEPVVEIDYNGELSQSELIEVIAFALREYFERYGCVPIDPTTGQPQVTKPAPTYRDWFVAHESELSAEAHPEKWLERHREINQNPEATYESFVTRYMQRLKRPK